MSLARALCLVMGIAVCAGIGPLFVWLKRRRLQRQIFYQRGLQRVRILTYSGEKIVGFITPVVLRVAEEDENAKLIVHVEMYRGKRSFWLKDIKEIRILT